MHVVLPGEADSAVHLDRRTKPERSNSNSRIRIEDQDLLPVVNRKSSRLFAVKK
jgi:hypothetical protein